MLEVFTSGYITVVGDGGIRGIKRPQSDDDIPIIRFAQCQAHAVNLKAKGLQKDIEQDPVLGEKFKTIMKFAVEASQKRSSQKRKNSKCAASFNALLMQNKHPTKAQKDNIGMLMYHNYTDLSEERKNTLRKQIMEFPLIPIPRDIRWTSLYYTIEAILECSRFLFGQN